MTVKKNLGTAALELLEKEPEITPYEMAEILNQLASKKLDAVIKENKNYGDEYYIQIILQQENFHRRNMPNIFHFQDVVTSTDPGMRPDRSCYKYNNKEDKLTYLWALPDFNSCVDIFFNKTELVKNERQLVGHVIDFYKQCLAAFKKKNKSRLSV